MEELGKSKLLKEKIFGIVLMLLLISIATLAFNIQPVKASGTIYIRADGSIDPPTSPISTPDNITYTFTDNIYDSIVVQQNNSIIDGAGYALQGTGSGTGIDLSYRKNVTVRNVNVIRFYTGITLYYSSRCVIHTNNVVNNTHCGVGLGYSDDNIIFCNNLTNNAYGVIVAFSMNNRIYHNNFFNNAVQGGSKDSANYWDDGYPSGGNYWSDYRGIDEKSGSNQDQPGSDGIEDTPYDIFSEGPLAKDNYPLMHVIPEFPSALILPLFMTLSAMAIVLTKKKATRRLKT